MAKPTLRVTRWLGDIPVEAECTACVAVRFNVKPISHRPTREEYQSSLERAFKAHVEKVHMQTDSGRKPS